ncbi:hypothetical protein [Shivajiella indica]|uniref:Alpha-L-rhamnosidase six-hairpin glycosidase domain-containing protein n=1 Tax=Shivajiella indica TaxID=872115 RepID=A0ABW5B6X2_9BACT
MKRDIIICLILFFVVLSDMAFSQKIHWIRSEGGERNEYVFFRKDFDLNEEAKEAQFHLYVDSRYALYVNGHYLGFGPVRSYHANPYFDTYDLKPFLKVGENVIAVLAMNNGMETFQLFDNRGGAAFWGEIFVGNKKIDLGIHSWKAKKSAGYDQSTPRFSFAKGPIESWDLREDSGWNAPGINLEAWMDPVPVRNQSVWGDMRSRPIPFLTKLDIKAFRLMGVYLLKKEEDFFTFRVLTPDLDIGEYSIGHPGLAYTYIYSPKKQKVNAGLWWGEYFLNGEKIHPKEVKVKSYHRQEFELKLNQGWNEMLVRNNVIWGTWDFYLTLPTNLGLSVSPSKKLDGTEWFRSFVPLDQQLELQIRQFDLGLGLDAVVKAFPNEWRSHIKAEKTNPAKDLAWMEPDRNLPLRASSVFKEPLIFTKDQSEIVLFFDMGEIHLGHFFVEGQFPIGSTIDIGFSEELNQEGLPWLYKRHQVGAGLRFVADGSQKRFQSFKPYGARYLKMVVRAENQSFTLDNVGMVRQVYPFEALGSFSSSDPLMDRIWEASWRTLQICAEDSYTDTPFRERGLYAGDMIPQMAMTQAVSGDMRLVKHSLNLFQDMYRPQMWDGEPVRHEDYILSSLVALDEYAKLTGDWELVREHYKNYKSLIGQYQSRYVNGLVKIENVFIEWTTLNKRDAAMTAYQALYYYSLKRLADWADRFGWNEDRESYLEEASKIKQSTHLNLWDQDHLNYFDGIKDGEILKEKHLTSTIWPVLMGVTEPEFQQPIISWLKNEILDIGQETRKEKISPYSAFYLFSLLYRHGESGAVENFIRKHWGPMALHNDRPTVWENFDVIESDIGTSSHAWSGHPMFFMATETLGVNLGFFKDFDPNTIEIKPQSETLTWAKGTVVHPLGPVEVYWRIEGENLLLDYKAPKGAKVLVQPKGKLSKLNLIINPSN